MHVLMMDGRCLHRSCSWVRVCIAPAVQVSSCCSSHCRQVQLQSTRCSVL